MDEQYKEQAYQLANIGHWELDVENEELYWSDQVKRLHEVPVDYQPDLASALAFYKEEDHRDKVQQAVNKAMEEGQSFSVESKIITDKGNSRWVRAVGKPVMKNGQCVCVYGSTQDITDNKQARQDLEDKQKQLQDIADNIRGSILRYRLHPDGSKELIYASRGLKDLYEISPEQAMESTDAIWSQIAEDHREELQEFIEASAENMTSWDHTFKIQTPSDNQKWIHARGISRRLEDGSIQWDVIEHDITEQKQLEEQVERQITLLDHILDSLPGLFFIADKDETFKRVNQHLELLFGASAEDLQGTDVLAFVAPRKKDEARQALQKVYTEGYTEHETILLDGDGGEHHYYICGTYFESDGGEYILGNGIDITDRVEIEEENSALLQEVHHRVKNNLAIISGILSMEIDELPSSSQNRLPLERSINRIHAIAKVHELLYQSSSFSQVNAREYISDLTQTVIETLQAERDQFDIQLDIPELQMNINEVIPLGMLINELLTNSLKHAFPDHQQGRITLDITQRRETYKVTYRDNGQGFVQNDFEESKSLGLTIANILLQQLQADYEINTEDGFEITFTFEPHETGSHANI